MKEFEKFVSDMESRIEQLKEIVQTQEMNELKRTDDLRKLLVFYYGNTIKVFDREYVSEYYYENWLHSFFRHKTERLVIKAKLTKQFICLMKRLSIILHDGSLEQNEQGEYSIKIPWVNVRISVNEVCKVDELFDLMVRHVGSKIIKMSRVNVSNMRHIINKHREVINRTKAVESIEWLNYTTDFDVIYDPIEKIQSKLSY